VRFRTYGASGSAVDDDYYEYESSDTQARFKMYQ